MLAAEQLKGVGTATGLGPNVTYSLYKLSKTHIKLYNNQTKHASGFGIV